MTRIAWGGLMRLGMVELRLAPEVFWGLTPVELMLLAGIGPGRAAMTRAGLEELLTRFPDGPRRERTG
jgi:uncharacterized phage protein (TIGR02216 family)